MAKNLIPLPTQLAATERRREEIQADVVALLEALLERARAGQLTYVAAICDGPNDGLSTVWQGIARGEQARDAIAGCAMLQALLVADSLLRFRAP